MEETKNERFRRVAAARVNKAVDMMHLIGNCSNKSNYEYTSEDVDRIFSALQLALDEARNKYESGAKRFSLQNALSVPKKKGRKLKGPFALEIRYCPGMVKKRFLTTEDAAKAELQKCLYEYQDKTDKEIESISIVHAASNRVLQSIPFVDGKATRIYDYY